VLADPTQRVGVVNTRDAKLHYFQTRYDRAFGARKVIDPFPPRFVPDLRSGHCQEGARG
jgi:hypothetical protein